MNRRGVLQGISAAIAALMLPVKKALPATATPETEIVPGEVVYDTSGSYVWVLHWAIIKTVLDTQTGVVTMTLQGSWYGLGPWSQYGSTGEPQNQQDQDHHKQ